MAQKQKLDTIFLVAFNIHDKEYNLLSRRLGILYATQDELSSVKNFYQKLHEVWEPYKYSRCNSYVYDIKIRSNLFFASIDNIMEELISRIKKINRTIGEYTEILKRVVPKEG